MVVEFQNFVLSGVAIRTCTSANSADGGNLAPIRALELVQFLGFGESKVVHDFIHQQ